MIFKKEINPTTRKEINKRFVIRFKDSTGKVKLVGAGTLHKYIGRKGVSRSEEMFQHALNSPNGTIFRGINGCTVTFTSRK